MAGQPLSAGGDGNQDRALRAFIPSVCGAAHRDRTPGMPGSHAVLDDDRPGAEATRFPIDGRSIVEAYTKLRLPPNFRNSLPTGSLSEEGRDKDQGITDDLPGEFEGIEQRKQEEFQCFHAPR